MRCLNGDQIDARAQPDVGILLGRSEMSVLSSSPNLLSFSSVLCIAICERFPLLLLQKAYNLIGLLPLLVTSWHVASRSVM